MQVRGQTKCDLISGVQAWASQCGCERGWSVISHQMAGSWLPAPYTYLRVSVSSESHLAVNG